MAARKWVTVSCRVDEDIERKYVKQCKKMGMTKAAMTRHFVEEIAAGNITLEVAAPKIVTPPKVLIKSK